jgi:hypothetical protein
MKRVAALVLVAAIGTACASSSPTGTSATSPSSVTPGTSSGAPTTPGPPHTIIVGGTNAVPDDSPTTVTAQPVASGGVGSQATRYLRDAESSRIVVQVITQQGAAPQQATINHVVSVLSSASGKAVSTAGGSVSGDRQKWSSADIRGAAIDAAADTPADTAVLRLLFLRGQFDEGGDHDDEVIGLSVAGDVAAIFSDKVDGAATGLVSPAHIEDSVTTHEVGHLLGLVDLVLHTGRADPAHPGHSRNRGSVMYWAVESSLVTDLLTGGPPRDFDAEDKADLATIRRG